MKARNLLAALSMTVIFSAHNTLLAQNNADDVAVMAVVEQQWEANQNGDSKWLESLLAEDFTGWSKTSPAPRSKESIRMWDKFESKQWDGEEHELYFLGIVVHENTAVVHYLYTSAGKNAEGKTEVINGRYTDVLVRIDGGWKFITWHGGADNDD